MKKPKKTELGQKLIAAMSEALAVELGPAKPGRVTRRMTQPARTSGSRAG